MPGEGKVAITVQGALRLYVEMFRYEKVMCENLRVHVRKALLTEELHADK